MDRINIGEGGVGSYGIVGSGDIKRGRERGGREERSLGKERSGGSTGGTGGKEEESCGIKTK